MKKTLLPPPSNLFESFSPKSTPLTALLLLVLTLGFTTASLAQCIGPYQGYESFTGGGTTPRNNMIAAGWDFNNASVTPTASASNSRSGTNVLLLGSIIGNAATTPVINSPKIFQFYYRSSIATRDVLFTVEWLTSDLATVLGSSGALQTNLTSYKGFSVDLSAYTNVRVRITYTGITGTSGTPALFVDDMSWTSTSASQNTKVVPGQTGDGAPSNCTGGIILLGSTTSTSYDFYDNGGVSDGYNLNQNNQITFKPSPAEFTAGDRVRIQFLSYAGAAGDKIEVWDNNGATLDATTNLLTHTLTTAPTVTTYISTISSDGSITVKFTSDGATNALGFNIKVDLVRCPVPSGLSASGVTATDANINWNTTTAGAYDLYYNTTGTLPNGYITPQFTNIGTNSYNLTGLAAGNTYYVWVRSRCGSSPDSYSPWSSVLSFSTVDCSAFSITTSPSTSTQTVCLNASATALSVVAAGGTGYSYQWYSNALNSNSGGSSIGGATSATYTPLTTSTGTLYYYCVVTSVTPACSKTSNVSGAIVVNGSPSAPTANAGTSPATTTFSANWSSVSGATGYYLDVSTASDFSSFVSGYNNLAVGNVITYSVTGLSPGGTYYYRVRTAGVCGTSGSSNVITCNTISLSYCTPTAPATNTTSVNNFSTTGGITNISNLNTGFTTGGYANYTAQSCSQYPSSAINYSITSNRTDVTDQTFYYYIWIDWNSDGDFADAGETILATTTYQPGPFTGAFMIPAAQAAGSYRMRVSTSWVGANTSCAINATYGRGEMEDYTIVVVPVPPCAPSIPSTFAASSITATGAVISWSDSNMTPNSIYDYYVSTGATTPLSTATPTGTVTGVNSATLTGLILGQTYYFWVRSNCGSPSAWEGTGNFITVNQDVVNMTNGSKTSCNVRFYDSGGSGSNYSNNETYTYTFYPGTPNTKLKVVFNSFRTEAGYDGLMIYNGNSTTAPLISSGLAVGTDAINCPAGSYRGTTSPGTIYSTAADGSLTFKFTSDYLVSYSGWDATISCVVVPIISSFTPTNVCAGNTPTVTLTGVNFTGATSVKFNNVSAAFTVVNDTTITTTLPVSATTGYITVSNATSTGTSTTVFSVNPIPSTPSAGSNVAICNGSSTTLNGSSSSTNAVTVLSEDFNTGAWPSAWTRTLNGGYNPGDFRTSSEFLSGGNTWPGNGYTGYCSYFYSYSISSGTSGDMISPAMDLSPYTSASLTFWIYNSSGTDLLKVYANNNNGVYTQVGTNYATYGTWTQITVNLSSYVGSGFTSVRLKFSGTSDNGGSNIGVDDIQVTGSNTSTFVWSPSTNLSSTIVPNPTANPTSTTVYTITTSYASGCSASSSVTVTVNPKPTVSIPTASANVCGNSVVPVTATGTATTYTWSSSVANTLFTDATGLTPYTGDSRTSIYVKTSSTATITVTGTDALGCFDTATVTFSVVQKKYLGSGIWLPGGFPANDFTENFEFVSGTYNSSGDLRGCSCTVSGGTVNFNNGHNLSLVNGLTVTSGGITFNDGSSLLQINDVANSGNIVYRRNSTACFKYDYTYWSSPVVGQTLIGLSPSTTSDGFFDYNPAISNWQQTNYNSTMTIGKGYLIRVPGSFPVSPDTAQPFTAVFSGVPNNGTIPLNVVHNPANELNLIGNPYPSAINATALVTDPGFNVNGGFLSGSLYFWSHNTNLNMTTGQYTFSDYAVWNVLGGTNTYYNGIIGAGNSSAPSGNIPAGQGFFAKTLASGTAYFRNSMRTGGATNSNTYFYRSNSSANSTSSTPDNSNGNAFEKHRIWLDLDNGADAYKQLLVGYIEGGTDGLDHLFDGEMVDNGNDVTFYSKVDNTKLSIQGRGLTFAPTDTFALGYKAKVANTYTVSLFDYDGLFANQDIYLEDKMLNVIHNLKESSYAFASEVGEFETRFVLRFTSETLGLPSFTDTSVVVYKNNDGLFVNSGQLPMQSVTIYDVTGRLITTQNNVNATQVRFATLPKTNQVLLVKITSETGAVVTRKVLY